MTKEITEDHNDIKGLALATEEVFDTIKEAKAHLNDNFTTGNFLIYHGAQVVRIYLKDEE